jgi:hypothetical protein
MFPVHSVEFGIVCANVHTYECALLTFGYRVFR